MAYNFVNPYNFFSLGKEKVKHNSKPELSGVIKFSLYTKTPLMIPDTTKAFTETVLNDDKEQEHEHYAFMSLNDLTSYNGKVEELTDKITKPDKPYIPGSQVRGMFRSAYEMLTDSCLSILNDDNILSKRTHEAFKAGLLCKGENNSYSLYSADDCIFRADATGSVINASQKAGTYKWNGKAWEYCDTKTKSYKINPDNYKGNYHEGQQIYFKRDVRNEGKFKSTAKNLSLKYDAVNSPDKGYLLKGLEGPVMKKSPLKEKHNCHIFYNNSNKLIDSVDLSILDTVIEMYKQNGKNLYEEYEKYYTEFKSKGEIGSFFPVYYSVLKEGGSSKNSQGETLEVFLSPAVFTREIYQRRVKDLAGSFNPCTSSKDACPACSLFGMISKKKDDTSIASKIRFSDMQFVSSDKNGNKPNYRGATTLIPLSTPKISNMEFYLERPDKEALFWTYDYYVTVDGQIKRNDKGINGRKFYWHHKNLLTTDGWLKDKKTNQNKTIYPLDSGNTFEGELYFDKISKTELDRLVCLLDWGKDDSDSIKDRTHCYKLGSGKPAGLGSVAVKVDSVSVRGYSDDKYTISSYTSQNADFKNLDNFKKITDFSMADFPKDYDVDYPRTEKNGDVFDWFTENHRGVYRKGDVITTNKYGDKIIKMPNDRRSELFISYMEAMSPELKDIKCLVDNDEKIDNKPQRGDIIEVTALNSSRNNKGSGFICNFNYGTYRGTAFSLTEFIEKDSKFRVKVTSIKDGKQIYGDFYKE